MLVQPMGLVEGKFGVGHGILIDWIGFQVAPIVPGSTACHKCIDFTLLLVLRGTLKHYACVSKNEMLVSSRAMPLS